MSIKIAKQKCAILLLKASKLCVYIHFQAFNGDVAALIESSKNSI